MTLGTEKFPLRVWLLVGLSCSTGLAHTHEYMGNINYIWRVIKGKDTEFGGVTEERSWERGRCKYNQNTLYNM